MRHREQQQKNEKKIERDTERYRERDKKPKLKISISFMTCIEKMNFWQTKLCEPLKMVFNE